jgi:putative flippase GtrA
VTVIAPEVALAPTVVLVDRRRALPRQFVRFAAVGVVNTALFLAVYLMFRMVVSATAANLLATCLATVTGTNANGKVTFGVKGPIGLRHHVKSMVVTGLGLAITTGAVSMVGTGDSELVELVVLVVAGAAAGAVRFVLLRHWVFDDTTHKPAFHSCGPVLVGAMDEVAGQRGER